MSTEQPNTTFSNIDWQNTNSLLNILLGIGTLSLGAGITWGSAKAFLKRLKERRRPIAMQPSKGLHNAYNANRIAIDNSYFPPELKEASYKVKQYSQFVKQSSWVSKWLESVFDWGSDQAAKGTGKVALSAAPVAIPMARTANSVERASKNIKDTVDAVRDQKAMQAAGENLGAAADNSLSVFFTGGGRHTFRGNEVGNYTQLDPTDSTWDHIKGKLAQRPSLWPLWFFPGAVGALGVGWKGGNALAEWVDSLLGKSEQRKDYSEEAKKIYEESAKLLKDVASGKIKPKMEKESAHTPAPGSTAVTGTGEGGFPVLQGIAGILLAGILAKQLSGVSKGIADSKEELADRTHMLWAALAAQKERDYDYNGLYIDPDNMVGDLAKDRKLNKKTTQMRNNMKPDNNQAQLSWENEQMGKIRAKTYR